MKRIGTQRVELCICQEVGLACEVARRSNVFRNIPSATIVAASGPKKLSTELKVRLHTLPRRVLHLLLPQHSNSIMLMRDTAVILTRPPTLEFHSGLADQHFLVASSPPPCPKQSCQGSEPPNKTTMLSRHAELWHTAGEPNLAAQHQLSALRVDSAARGTQQANACLHQHNSIASTGCLMEFTIADTPFKRTATLFYAHDVRRALTCGKVGCPSATQKSRHHTQNKTETRSMALNRTQWQAALGSSADTNNSLSAMAALRGKWQDYNDGQEGGHAHFEIPKLFFWGHQWPWSSSFISPTLVE